MKTLEYYYADGSHVVFDKYTINTEGVVRNKKTGKILSTHNNTEGYKSYTVMDDNRKRRNIQVGRAIASTFIGTPPTQEHTVDHIDRDSNNDIVENLRWLCKKGQRKNQRRSETSKSAFVVVKDGVERTVSDWVEQLKNQRNSLGREYTRSMIEKYAQNKQCGFSYKEYPDLYGEVWKEVNGSKTKLGRWEISNMSRVKYVTKHAENVLFEERLRLHHKYPTIKINGKQWKCHILSFMTFFPEEYASKKSDEMVLHENDDKLDFRPHKLRLGTQTDNTKDAHENGRHDGKNSERKKCTSYINNSIEREYESQYAAVRYLRSLGLEKATHSGIRSVLDEKYKTAYGRTWIII